MPRKSIPAEALIDLHRRLATLPPRSHERRMIMHDTAKLYGVSDQTLYRALAARARPKALRRADRGTLRALLCELLNSKPREINAFIRGQLPPDKTQQLSQQLLAAGVPL